MKDKRKAKGQSKTESALHEFREKTAKFGKSIAQTNRKRTASKAGNSRKAK